MPGRVQKGVGREGSFRKGAGSEGPGKERVRTPKARTSECVMEGAGPRWIGLQGGLEEGESWEKMLCRVLKGRSLEVNCLRGGAMRDPKGRSYVAVFLMGGA